MRARVWAMTTTVPTTAAKMTAMAAPPIVTGFRITCLWWHRPDEKRQDKGRDWRRGGESWAAAAADRRRRARHGPPAGGAGVGHVGGPLGGQHGPGRRDGIHPP